MRPGSTFTYRFIADAPGTYFFHPHVGVQLDRGLYAPLIVEDPREPLAYDDEWVVLLDDWVDGVTGTPDEVFAELKQGNWAINGKPFDMATPDANPILIEEGRRVRLDFVNDTTMWHPMHLHGHTYQLGGSGPRKDTAIVLPKKTLSVFFDADNPGQWMLHCHNAYHGEAGMMTNVAYQA
ncbi:FtsP/CotA-like multicopper oxidase with cupredoxin domain [Streptomyces sp. B4I13]|nr:FtsP/CotA-like multicopper oxidase with cupredoxin domain [Streptomyces sp. B4I13]